MGRKYNEKVKKHFWMLVCDTMGETSDANAFKKKYETAFKIDSKEALKLYLDHFWNELYSIVSNVQDPNEMKEELDPIVHIDGSKVKSNMWELIVFAFSKNRDKKAFREAFESLIRINTKEALKFVEEPLWRELYSVSSKTKKPEELGEKLESILQLDIKRAAEVIKEINPEKHELLSYYK